MNDAQKPELIRAVREGEPGDWFVINVRGGESWGPLTEGEHWLPFDDHWEYYLEITLYRTASAEWFLVTERSHCEINRPLDLTFRVLSDLQAAEWLLENGFEPPNDVAALVQGRILGEARAPHPPVAASPGGGNEEAAETDPVTAYVLAQRAIEEAAGLEFCLGQLWQLRENDWDPGGDGIAFRTVRECMDVLARSMRDLDRDLSETVIRQIADQHSEQQRAMSVVLFGKECHCHWCNAAGALERLRGEVTACVVAFGRGRLAERELISRAQPFAAAVRVAERCVSALEEIGDIKAVLAEAGRLRLAARTGNEDEDGEQSSGDAPQGAAPMAGGETERGAPSAVEEAEASSGNRPWHSEDQTVPDAFYGPIGPMSKKDLAECVLPPSKATTPRHRQLEAKMRKDPGMYAVQHSDRTFSMWFKSESRYKRADARGRRNINEHVGDGTKEQ